MAIRTTIHDETENTRKSNHLADHWIPEQWIDFTAQVHKMRCGIDSMEETNNASLFQYRFVHGDVQL